MLMMVNVVRACYYCHHCHYDAYDVRMIKKCSCKLGPSVRLSVTVFDNLYLPCDMAAQ